MIASLLLVLVAQNPPPPPPPPRAERSPREQEAIERLRRELDALPPNSPERDRKQAELRRLEMPQPRPANPPPRPPNPDEDPLYKSFKRDGEEQTDPRRGPPRPEAPPHPPVPLEQVRAWLRENDPETSRRVEQASGEEGRGAEAFRLLREAEPRVREMIELKNRDPKAFEKTQELRRLERESLEIAERARGASPADREVAVKKLKESLDRLFDLREEQKARELDELKRRVGEIEKQLETRKASKERIVDRRKRELLGERLQDDW